MNKTLKENASLRECNEKLEAEDKELDHKLSHLLKENQQFGNDMKMVIRELESCRVGIDPKEVTVKREILKDRGEYHKRRLKMLREGELDVILTKKKLSDAELRLRKRVRHGEKLHSLIQRAQQELELKQQNIESLQKIKKELESESIQLLSKEDALTAKFLQNQKDFQEMDSAIEKKYPSNGKY